MSRKIWESDDSISAKIEFFESGKWIYNGEYLLPNLITDYLNMLEKRPGLFGTVIERFELKDDQSDVRFRRITRGADVWWDVIVPAESDGVPC